MAAVERMHNEDAGHVCPQEFYKLLQGRSVQTRAAFLGQLGLPKHAQAVEGWAGGRC